MRPKGLFFAAALLLVSTDAVGAQALPAFVDYFFDHSTTKTVDGKMETSAGLRLKVITGSFVDAAGTLQKAMVYAQDSKSATVYLTILGPFVFGTDGRVLVDVSKAPGVFWGWRLRAFENKATGATGIAIQWYADSGKRTTDEVDLSWDPKKGTFSVWQIDPSQY